MTETPAEPQALSGREIVEAAIAAGPGWCGKPEPHGPHQVDEWNVCGGGATVMTPAEPLSAEDVRNLNEVVNSQIALGHDLTLVPTDVLERLLRAATRESTGAGLDVELLAAFRCNPGHQSRRSGACGRCLAKAQTFLAAARLPDPPRERIVDITGVDAIEAAVLRSLLDEVETLCEDNGQNAIRTDDLAALIHARLATPPDADPA